MSEEGSWAAVGFLLLRPEAGVLSQRVQPGGFSCPAASLGTMRSGDGRNFGLPGRTPFRWRRRFRRGDLSMPLGTPLDLRGCPGLVLRSRGLALLAHGLQLVADHGVCSLCNS